MSLPILTGADRDAFDRFPAEINDRELGAFFTLIDDDLERITAVHDAAARFVLAVEVGAVRWLGFIPDDVRACPGPAVAYLAEQLDVDAGLRDEHARLGAVRGAICDSAADP